MRNDYTDIKLQTKTGDVDVVITLLKDVLANLPSDLKFKCAQISQNNPWNVPDDKDNDAYYPLKLYAENNVRIMISEVRCGYHGASSDAMIECLKLAGFPLKRSDIEAIYNNPVLDHTIYNETVL